MQRRTILSWKRGLLVFAMLLMSLPAYARSQSRGVDVTALQPITADNAQQLQLLATWQQVENADPAGRIVFDVAFSPSSDHMATLAADRTLCYWDIFTGHCRREEMENRWEQLAIDSELQPNERPHVAVAAPYVRLGWIPYSSAVSLLKPNDGWEKVIVRIRPGTHLVTAGLFRSSYTPSSPTAPSVRQWDVSGMLIWALGFTESVYDLKYSADGKTLLIAGETATYLWDVDADKEIARIAYSDSSILGAWVAISPDQRIIATYQSNTQIGNDLQLWDMDYVLTNTPISAETARRTVAVALNGAHINDMDFTPNNEVLVTAGFVTFALWDARTGIGLFRAKLDLEMEGLTALDINRDGTLIATSSSDGMVRLWGVPK